MNRNRLAPLDSPESLDSLGALASTHGDREVRLEEMSREELILALHRLRHVHDESYRAIARVERVEAENARLRDGQTELATLGARAMELYEEAPVAYVVLDEAGVIREVNREAARMLGEDMWELRGKPLNRFVAAKERRGFNDHVHRSCRSNAESSITVTLQTHSSKLATVRLLSRPLPESSGHLGVRTVLLDVSDDKRGEEALRLAVRMREDFLAVVAHDLRSPLAAIVMSAELLERHAPHNREIERIRRSTMRMNRLAADLLDLSSMEAGRLAMAPAAENVESLIVAALEIASPLAARKSISLSAHVDGEIIEAWCDRERVIQALLNLITNAVKFTTSGAISVRAKKCAGEVQITVHDTGRGLSRGQIERIFDPYWQVSPGREGTGLGLSIVKGIVQLHGGRIWVESRQGRGSSFSFTLPLQAPAGETAEPVERSMSRDMSRDMRAGGLDSAEGVEITAPLPRPTLSSLNDTPSNAPLVMLIDDEGAVRESISEALRGEGYDVVAVPHGRAALDYLERASTMPSLILLDLVMPVMDGWEFLRQQSRAPRLAAVPVVLVSAQAEQQQQQQALDNEPAVPLAGYIQKPVRLARLCEVVGSCAATA